MSYDTAFTALLAAGWPEIDAAELAQITIDLQAKAEEAARAEVEATNA